MINTADLVEKILAENPLARDSDHELILDFLRRKMMLTEAQEEVLRSIVFESITRARRKIQEGGKWLPNPEVARHRRLKSAAVQQTAPSATPQQLADTVETPWDRK